MIFFFWLTALKYISDSIILDYDSGLIMLRSINTTLELKQQEQILVRDSCFLEFEPRLQGHTVYSTCTRNEGGSRDGRKDEMVMRTKREIETPKAVIRDTKEEMGEAWGGSCHLAAWTLQCLPAIDVFAFLNLFFFFKEEC